MLAQEDQEEPSGTVQAADNSQLTRSLQYVAGAACAKTWKLGHT